MLPYVEKAIAVYLGTYEKIKSLNDNYKIF